MILVDKLALVNFATTSASVIANVCLVWLTSRYVHLTREMLKEMRSSHDPQVHIDLEFPSKMARISIRNSGLSPAYNVQFHIDDNAPWQTLFHDGPSISSIPVIKTGVSYLPPDRVLKYPVGILDWSRFSESTSLIQIKISYEDQAHRKFTQEYHLDIGQYNGTLYESFRNPLLEVAAAITSAENSRSTSSYINREILTPREPTRIQCPSCAEPVLPEARKCPHCMEAIPHIQPA